MRIVPWDEVRTVLGPKIESYCKNRKMFIQRTDYGAFFVKNQYVLKDFERIFEEIHSKNSDTQQCKLVTSDILRCSQNRITGRRMPTVKILLRDSGEKIPTYYTPKISKNYILNTISSGSELMNIITNMKIECGYQFTCIGYFPNLESILNQLRINHSRFNYSAILLHMLKEDLKEERLKHQYKIPRNILHKYFRLVFMRVIPLKLFGNYKNRRKVMKIIGAFLDTARYEFLDLGYYIQNLDLQSMSWLTLYKVDAHREIIMAKLLKWLFTGFIIPIVHSQFHVMQDPEVPYGRAFIQIDDWCRIKKKFIKTMKRKGIITPAAPNARSTCPKGKCTLLPKTSCVRPIVRIKYTDNERRDHRLISQFLHQLYITQAQWVTDSSFHRCWKDIVKDQRMVGDHLYVVSCDIINAFGSVVQKLLHNILQNLCDNIPDILQLQWLCLLCSDRKTMKFKKYFTNLKLSVPKGAIFTRGSPKVELVKKNWLLLKIARLIFEQQVQVGNKNYVVNKGIAQGPMVSPILANIYYNFLIEQKMSQFHANGKLLRYADDLLYVTNNYREARKFLSMVEKGIPQFNCYFKKSKTYTNLYNQLEISYLGYNIRCDNLEVEPKFHKANERLLISFMMKPDENIFQVYRRKLNNYASLKLTRIVLDGTVNSKETMIKNLKIASLRFAKRARILTLYLFHNIIDKKILEIYNIIKTIMSQTTRIIVRFIRESMPTMTSAETTEWYRTISSLLTRSLKQVFRSHNFLQKSFKPLLAHKRVNSNSQNQA